MPYVPTLADVQAIDAEDAQNSSGGYVPTLADVQAIDAQNNYFSTIPSIPQMPQTLGQRLSGMIGNIAQGGINLGQGIEKGVEQGLPVPASMASTAFKVLNPLGSVMNTLPTNQSSGLYQTGTHIGQTIPGTILGATGVSSFLPNLGNVTKGLLIGGSGGASIPANSVGQRVMNIGTGAGLGAIGGGISNIPAGIRATGNLVKGFLARPEEAAEGIASSLTANPQIPGQAFSPDEMNSQLAQHITDNYNSNVNQGMGLFNNLFNKAQAKQYLPDVTIPSSSDILDADGNSTVPLNAAKKINISDATNEDFDDLLNSASSNSLQGAPKFITKLISNFKTNPSLQSAHQLQSALFKASDRINPEFSPLNANLQDTFDSARENLLNDISNTFKGNGDTDLDSQFSAARTYWKNNVVPYRENPLSKSILNGKSPQNIISQLGSIQPVNNTVTPSYNLIRNQIATNPNQLNTLIGATLSKATKYDGMTPTTSASDLLKAYATAPTPVRNMMQPVIGNKMNELNTLYTQKNNFRNFLGSTKGEIAKNILKGIGQGSLMGLGFKGMDDFF